ncbi:hypothetical protein LguiA_018459 [Lonicera macranthoides]
MEVATTPTATTNIRTPEPDTEKSIRIQPGKPLSFTNGVLKHHHHHPPALVTYKECLKNHAASMGGHALDGCGEFMPSPAAPLKCSASSLMCAACGCHRNFHRREPDDYHAPAPVQHVIEFQPLHRHHPPPPPAGSSPESPSPPPISSSYYPSAPHMLLALSAGLSGQLENPNPAKPATADAGAPANGNQHSRKRFRTKFTQNQKEKMHEFAERVQWKIQRSDEALIKDLCSEIGVERGVLKVWMHNNKSILGKKDENNHIKLSENLHKEEISSPGVVNTNGSSSSS